MVTDLASTQTHTNTGMAESVMLPNSPNAKPTPKVGCRRCVHCLHQVDKMTEVFCKSCLIITQKLCDAASNLCRADW